MAQNTTAKELNFASRAILSADKFLEWWEEAKALRQEYTSLDIGNQITQGELDTSPALIHLTPAIITSYMTTFDALSDLISLNSGSQNNTSGHLTNLFKMKG
jgi:hypothetical protein